MGGIFVSQMQDRGDFREGLHTSTLEFTCIHHTRESSGLLTAVGSPLDVRRALPALAGLLGFPYCFPKVRVFFIIAP